MMNELIPDGLHRFRYEVVFLGEKVDVSLVVQTFDEEDISVWQEEAFLRLDKDKGRVIDEVEDALYEYYVKGCPGFRDGVAVENLESSAPWIGSKRGLKALVELRRIKIMATCAAEVRDVGFIFDAAFDPQLGVGVLVRNEKVIDIDVQDIVLG